jgi:hypothetical protein
MSTNPNLITLLKKTSTFNLEVTNSTIIIFTQFVEACGGL